MGFPVIRPPAPADRWRESFRYGILLVYSDLASVSDPVQFDTDSDHCSDVDPDPQNLVNTDPDQDPVRIQVNTIT